MNIRERLEQQEYLLLAPYACRSAESAGRKKEEPACDLRTAFQRDRDRCFSLPKETITARA